MREGLSYIQGYLDAYHSIGDVLSCTRETVNLHDDYAVKVESKAGGTAKVAKVLAFASFDLINKFQINSVNVI